MILKGYTPDKEVKPVESVKLETGTRMGTVKLIVNGKVTDNIPVKGGVFGSSGTASIEQVIEDVMPENNQPNPAGLYVPLNGDSTITGSLTATNFILSSSVSQSSDARLKDVIKDIKLSIEQIAEAPSVLFKYKDGRNKDIQGGTIAQYWQKNAPWAVGKDEKDYLTLNYSALALAASIECARQIVEIKKKLNEIEDRL